jgi:precorrin-6x reductase
MKNHSERLIARVLPSVESIELCLEAGILPSHIICMQGPFSHEMNLAMFRDMKAKILVTKESGASGGFNEKLSAARELGMSVFLLKRPPDESETSMEDVIKIIGSR